MSTTTGNANPLLLEGTDLIAARRVAVWGTLDRANIWLDCRPAGSSVPLAGEDPDRILEACVRLTLRLEVSHGYDVAMPLEREHVELLEWLTRHEIANCEYILDDQETSGRAAEIRARLDDALHVLEMIPGLTRALPPVATCEHCGQEVT